MRSAALVLLILLACIGCIRSPGSRQVVPSNPPASPLKPGESVGGSLSSLVIKRVPGDSIFGLVWGPDGKPLQRCTVRSLDGNVGTITNPQGWFSLRRPAGQKTLLFEMLGYFSRRVQVPETGGVFLSVPLAAPVVSCYPEAPSNPVFEITVQVLDTRTGNGLEVPVSVEARDTDGSERSVRKLAQPPVTLRVPRSGYYDFFFSADGYRPARLDGVFAGMTSCDSIIGQEILAWLSPWRMDGKNPEQTTSILPTFHDSSW